MHKQYEPGLRKYTPSGAKEFFNAPSIGFTATGSYIYVYRYGSAWLRILLHMIRIASFVHRPQIDFGMGKVEMTAPTGPTFLGEHTMGTNSWDEDTKRPWEKIPDGCLFVSFGYRGLSNIYLDERVVGSMDKFFRENRAIFEHIKNPWSKTSINDIEPSLDILSSATQIPDIGAKILLLYCSLEHLFVPKNVNVDNKKYIVGGINALRPELLNWFNRLYKVRCDYAHKGYVVRDDSMRSFVFESTQNVLSLLASKIRVEHS